MTGYLQAIREAAAFLKDYDDFIVINHVSPDGDAVGSLLGMAALLEKLCKKYTLINEGKTPKKFSFVPRYEKIINFSEESFNGRFKAVITVDCADRERMGGIIEIIDPGTPLLNIDHHPTNDLFGTHNLVRIDACSTAEVIYDLARHMNIGFTSDLAVPLFTGFLTDTGGFRYANTTSDVLKKAADLIAFGVNPGQVAERALETITEAHVKLLQRALTRLEITHGGKVASLYITLDDIYDSGATEEDMDGIVNYPRNIEGVEVGVYIKQMDADLVKVSLRSREFVDVAAIAKEWGGGGHVRAAGFSMKGSVGTVKEKIMERLSKELGDVHS